VNGRISRIVAATVMSAASVSGVSFDHGYAAYAAMLSKHVRPLHVDYAALKAAREALDRVVDGFNTIRAEPTWTRDQRMAFWINAYNVFALRLIVDHYPIRSGWLPRQPRNSIRQIDGA
jgi:hypothetical protein